MLHKNLTISSPLLPHTVFLFFIITKFSGYFTLQILCIVVLYNLMVSFLSFPLVILEGRGAWRGDYILN